MSANEKIHSIGVLGSTGSVGTQALDVADMMKIKVGAISCNRNIKLAEEQIRRFAPDICACIDEDSAKELKVAVADTQTKILSGRDSLRDVCSYDGCEMILNSVTGVAGLMPSVWAMQAGKRLALANKETIVTAGELFMKDIKANNITLIPVDSEHSAVFQCLGAGRKDDVKNIVLTASGGPFFGMKREALSAITPEIALAHPTWNMGAKITIDSATLMNKGFEVIEAMYLFAMPVDNVKVVVHRESIIHSLVEYNDNSMFALLSCPDMRLCVQYAVTYPKRTESLLKPLDLAQIGSLTFAQPDCESFALLSLAYKAAADKGTSGAILNGANEVAVAAYLNGKIGFNDITDSVIKAYESVKKKPIHSYSDVFEADSEARDAIASIIDC